MNNKKIIISICIIILIGIAITLAFIMNNSKNNKNIVGTYYAKTPLTTYTIEISGNHTAIMQFDDKTRHLSWDDKYFREGDMPISEYELSNENLLIKFARGTLEFSKNIDLERIEKTFQAVYKKDTDESEISILENSLKDNLIITNVSHVYDKIYDSVIIDSKGSKKELNSLKMMLEGIEIIERVKEVY